MNAKKLGFGLMRLPKNDPANAGDIDIEQVKKMVDLFLSKGFTYFDTAWMYCGFNSEATAKTVLVDRYPRDSFTLATKLHNGFFNSLEDRDRILREQLTKTGAGYFDYYMLHGVEEGSYPKYEQFDCFHWLKKKKEQGLMKTIGISFHAGPELLDEILTKYPFIEFVQLQINYLDWESQWIQSRRCYETAVMHGKPIIVMEPVKGGTLARVPAEVEKLFRAHTPDASPASWAIRFAASLPGVMMVLSGMSSLARCSLHRLLLLHRRLPPENRYPPVFLPLQRGYAGASGRKGLDGELHQLREFDEKIRQGRGLYWLRPV